MRLVAALVAVVALGAGCQARVGLEITVRPDGSGTVEVGLGLDDEALGELDASGPVPVVADLVEAGWTASRGRPSAEGLSWIRLSKPFSGPDQFAAVVAELSGPEGPLRDLALVADQDLFRWSASVSGLVDLSDGAAGMVDAGVREAMGEIDVGLDAEGLRRRFGPDLDDSLGLEVVVSLPGSTRRWPVLLGEVAPVAATAEGWRVGPTAAAGAAVGFVALALAVATSERRKLARRRRRMA